MPRAGASVGVPRAAPRRGRLPSWHIRVSASAADPFLSGGALLTGLPGQRPVLSRSSRDRCVEPDRAPGVRLQSPAVFRRIGIAAGVLSMLACAPDALAGTLANGTFTAGPGEANALTVTVGNSSMRLTDSGAPLRAGARCTQVDGATATCATSQVVVQAGDGDDVVTVVSAQLVAPAPFEEQPSVTVTAGVGSDTVRGSTLDEVFVDGGAGEADTYEGTAGRDELRYTGRTDGVRVALAGGGEDRIVGITRVV